MFQGHLSVTQEMILNCYSEDELFHHYCPNFVNQDEFFKSDLRKEDKPSCRITDFGGYLLYKDFGSPEKGVNIWGYIMRKFGVNYRTALDIVARDLGLSANVNAMPTAQSESLQHKPTAGRTIIKIKKRPWLIKDKQYWYEKYGIPRETLEDFCVRPISDYWLNDTHVRSAHLGYSYDYYWHNNRFLRKLYQPFSKTKWISNIDNTVVQGIANIPKTHDLMIIGKSLKDVMCLRLLGYFAVAPNNELGWIPESVWLKFITRYKEMVIFFDNDESGIASAKRFSYQYGIPYIIIPPEYKEKDISDFIETYGHDEAKLLLTELLWQKGILQPSDLSNSIGLIKV